MFPKSEGCFPKSEGCFTKSEGCIDWIQKSEGYFPVKDESIGSKEVKDISSPFSSKKFDRATPGTDLDFDRARPKISVPRSLISHQCVRSRKPP